jgi:prepilin-type N-terminal cleavage/methylation domain-containing protein
MAMRKPNQDHVQRGVTLVELLVVMAIMSIVSMMVIVVWASLRDSYAYTTTSSQARDYTRGSMSRMAREIRDAVAGPNGADAFVTADDGCGPYRITFYTLFNEPGATAVDATPRLVQFYLEDSTLYRRIDSDNDGTLDGSEGVSVLCTNVVNQPGQDLFAYTVTGWDGGQTRVQAPDDPTAIVNVDIALLVDLNLGKAPVLMDLATSVQPRNLRQL